MKPPTSIKYVPDVVLILCVVTTPQVFLKKLLGYDLVKISFSYINSGKQSWFENFCNT